MICKTYLKYSLNAPGYFDIGNCEPSLSIWANGHLVYGNTYKSKN